MLGRGVKRVAGEHQKRILSAPPRLPVPHAEPGMSPAVAATANAQREALEECLTL